jgi:hypothetical protein
MGRRLLTVLAAGVMAAACATTFDFQKAELFETSAKGYGRLIRWSEFENARGYLASDAPAERSTPPQQVRVTEYEPAQVVVSDDRNQVIQVVKITYFKADNPRVRSIEDRQLWEFDPKKDAWFLKSGLPEFK